MWLQRFDSSFDWFGLSDSARLLGWRRRPYEYRRKPLLLLLPHQYQCMSATKMKHRQKSNEASRRAVQPQHSTIRRRSCSRHSPQPRNRTPPEQHDEQRRGRQERGLEGRPEHRQHQGPRTGAMTSPCRLDLACEPRLGRRRRPHARGCGARGAPPRLGGGPPPLGLPLEAGARRGYPQRSGARLNRIHGVRRMAPRSSSRSSASRR